MEGKARIAGFKWSILNVAIHTIFCMGYACAVGYYKYSRFDVKSMDRNFGLKGVKFRW